MMKDRRIKQIALQYAIGKRWFPQLELLVYSTKSVSKKPFDITDIDVYAAAPDDFSGYRSILFDCKSGNNESPVKRALWLNGLISHFHADRGICIFNDEKNISLDHRETAIDLNVSLMTAAEFNLFAQATDIQLFNDSSNLGDIDKWDKLFQIPQKYKTLESAISYSTGKFWTYSHVGDACRNTIATLKTLRGELDPAKKEHMVVFGDLLALFLFATAQVSNRLFKAYLHPSSRQDLDLVLLQYIYGGREAYSLAKQLRTAITHKGETSASTPELTLPEWDLFANLLRSMLDSPMQALHAPLLAREIAWSLFDDAPSLLFASQLANSKRQTGKFCMLATRYLVAAAKLPPEFAEKYQDLFLSVQSAPSSKNDPQPKLPNI